MHFERPLTLATSPSHYLSLETNNGTNYDTTEYNPYVESHDSLTLNSTSKEIADDKAFLNFDNITPEHEEYIRGVVSQQEIRGIGARQAEVVNYAVEHDATPVEIYVILAILNLENEDLTPSYPDGDVYPDGRRKTGLSWNFGSARINLGLIAEVSKFDPNFDPELNAALAKDQEEIDTIIADTGQYPEDPPYTHSIGYLRLIQGNDPDSPHNELEYTTQLLLKFNDYNMAHKEYVTEPRPDIFPPQIKLEDHGNVSRIEQTLWILRGGQSWRELWDDVDPYITAIKEIATRIYLEYPNLGSLSEHQPTMRTVVQGPQNTNVVNLNQRSSNDGSTNLSNHRTLGEQDLDRMKTDNLRFAKHVHAI